MGIKSAGPEGEVGEGGGNLGTGLFYDGEPPKLDTKLDTHFRFELSVAWEERYRVRRR